MAIWGKMSVRTKIVLYNHIVEQVKSFNFLGYTITTIRNKFGDKNE